MKNLAVALVFLLAAAGFTSTLDAQAHSVVRVEPALDQPLAFEMDEDDGATAIASKKKKKKDKDDKKEEDEEEYRYSSDSLRALELVDPGALNFVVRMNAAGMR